MRNFTPFAQVSERNGIFLKFFGVLAVFVGLSVSMGWGQATIFSENFGTTNAALPTGWTSSNTTAGWNGSTSSTSSTYSGYSAGANALFAGTGSNGVVHTLTYSNNLSTVGYNSITILWGGRGTSSFNSTITFQWSSDGTTWNPVSYNYSANGNAWALVNGGVRISLPVGAAGISNLRLRWLGASTNSGNYRIDDITVKGTVVTTSPTVTSSTPISITSASATLNGNVTSDGGSAISERGFFYKTSSGVTSGDTKITATGTTGTFTAEPTLSVNTRYYFKAYATNSIGTTLSSPELDFWTLANVPSAPTVNNATTTTLDVAVNANSNPSTTEFAIQETGGSQYVQADGTLGASAIWQTAATWGTKTVTGLSPSTSYTFQVKARNGANTETTFGSSAALSTAATSSPFLSVGGVAPAFTETCLNNPSGFLSFTISGTNLTAADVTVEALSGYSYCLTSGGTYTSSLTLASADVITNSPVTIYVKFTPTAAQSYNGNIVISGGGADNATRSVTGTGVNSAPTVTTTSPAASITSTTVTLSGEVTDMGCQTVTARGICYGTSSNPDINETKTTESGAFGSFSSNITNLSPNTLYHFRAYATSSAGTSYGSDETFTTSAIATPTATAATNLSYNGFTANWNAVSGAGEYKLDVGLRNDFLDLSESTIALWNFSSALTPTSSILQNNSKSVSTGGGASSVTLSSGTARADNWNSGSAAKYWEINITTSGYYSLKISSKQRSSSTGPKNFKLQYKIGVSGTYTDVNSGTIVVADNYTTGALSNLSLPTECNNQSDLYIRWIMTSNTSVGDGTVASTGGSNIDDINIIGYVPFFVSGYNNLSVSGTSQAVTGLSPNTTYYYRVRATSTNSTSANSNVISATTSSTIPVSSGSTNASDLPVCITCDLTVASGATLTVNASKTYNSVTVAPGAKLTLQDGFTLTAPITLQSNGSGTATFVDERTAENPTPVVTATVEQRLPQGRNWYLSSPVANGSTTSLAGEGLGTSVSYWNEAGSAWVNNYSGTLTRGRGYVAVSSAGSGSNNASFTGDLYSGTVPVSLTRKGSSSIGYNLIANPYPSYLNAMAAINANSNVQKTIWYRTRSTGQTPLYKFETVNTTSGEGTNAAGTGTVTGYVPPMQAFWVRTLTDDNSITFTNAMRYHGNPTIESTTIPTTPLKAPSNTQTANKLVRLEVAKGSVTDETVIYFNPNATKGFDDYDSPKWSNASAAIPELYTIVSAETLAINGLPEIVYNTELPLGFYAGTESAYSIRAKELRNFGSDVRVILKDGSTEYDLTNGDAYEFNSAAANNTSRFSIIFRTAGVATSVDNSKLNTSTNVFVNANGELMVKTNAPLSADAKVSVYNAVGQLISIKPLSSGMSIANAARTAGVYWVKITNDGETITRKVIVN